MPKKVEPFVRKAVCPQCGGDSFRIIAGHRPSKLPDYDNGYPFEAYECANKDCGWKSAPWDDLTALDSHLVGLFRGKVPEDRQFKYVDLPIPPQLDLPDPDCFGHFDDTLKCVGCRKLLGCRETTFKRLFGKRRRKREVFAFLTPPRNHSLVTV